MTSGPVSPELRQHDCKRQEQASPHALPSHFCTLPHPCPANFTPSPSSSFPHPSSVAMRAYLFRAAASEACADVSSLPT